MAITWSKNVDDALAQAQSSKRRVLVDFNAAPM